MSFLLKPTSSSKICVTNREKFSYKTDLKNIKKKILDNTATSTTATTTTTPPPTAPSEIGLLSCKSGATFATKKPIKCESGSFDVRLSLHLQSNFYSIVPEHEKEVLFLRLRGAIAQPAEKRRNLQRCISCEDLQRVYSQQIPKLQDPQRHQLC
jgi:hypothetical protein